MEDAARLRALIDVAVDPIITLDERGLMLSFNPAGERVFGYAADEVIGNNVSMLMPSPDREQHDGYLSRYKVTGEKRIIGIGRRVVAQRKDGSLVPVRLAVAEVTIGGKRHFMGTLHDLSEQYGAEEALARSEARMHELQDQLYRASRLGDLGEMATAIAHELNQPLTAVLNYVQTSRELMDSAKPEAQAKIRDFMDKAVAQADRAGKIIRRLRQLYERGESELLLSDVNGVVREAMGLALIGGSEKGVNVELALAANLPQVALDRTQIQQVVFNLVRNAVEAMSASEVRTLTVRTQLAGGQVEVSVLDSGPGLSEEVASHLFAPFLTTKPEGMGLGLSICRSIIESHGGTIDVTSHPGTGAHFRFSLPVDSEDANA